MAENEKMPPLVFEELRPKGPRSPFTMTRTKVSGGWIVAMYYDGNPSITFFPDPNHEWDGGSL